MAFTLRSSSAVVNTIVGFIEPPEVDGAEADVARPGREGREPDGSVARMWETFTHRRFPRMPPLLETRRTSKRSGDVTGCRRGT